MTIITSTPYASFFDRIKTHGLDTNSDIVYIPTQYISDDTFFTKSKNLTFLTFKKTKDFFAKPEVKVGSLLSYWATEALISALGIYAFISLAMYVPAMLTLLIFAYLTYATFGVINEVKL